MADPIWLNPAAAAQNAGNHANFAIDGPRMFQQRSTRNERWAHRRRAHRAAGDPLDRVPSDFTGAAQNPAPPSDFQQQHGGGGAYDDDGASFWLKTDSMSHSVNQVVQRRTDARQDQTRHMEQTRLDRDVSRAVEGTDFSAHPFEKVRKNPTTMGGSDYMGAESYLHNAYAGNHGLNPSFEQAVMGGARKGCGCNGRLPSQDRERVLEEARRARGQESGEDSD
jgi:hypothetical protein